MSEEKILKLKKEQRKESILGTALKVMSEKGIEATTMREIANIEGISETLLYRFFSNKQEILIELVQTRITKTIKGFEELVETIKVMLPDPKVTIPIIWKLGRKKVTENKELISLFMKEREFLHETIGQMMMQAHKNRKPFGMQFFDDIDKMNFEVVLQDYFKRCQEAGNIRAEIDPTILSPIFLRLITAPLLAKPLLIQLEHETSEEEKERFFQTQIDILLHGIIPKR